MKEFTDFQEKLARNCPDIRILYDEPMAKHTSFRIGGAAEAMAFPKDKEELARLLKVSRLLDCNPAILGAGTNVLAPDEGMAGLVICLKDCLDGMERLDDTHIRMFAAKQGLSGLEFAHGIPGTVGGGVYMNAGAYGGEIGSVLTQAEIMNPEGKILTLSREDMAFSYRHSRLEDTPGIVLSAVFCLTPADSEGIFARMKELMAKRSASQPLDLPSAGSAFKRPREGYAAALIDETGLKGFQVGGAAISRKHAGFAVNLGGATARDVKELLRQVTDRVYGKTGIRLEPEVRIWERS